MIAERNQEARKIRRANLDKDYSIKLDTAFGINSNPICNQLQIVGEKYVVFMVGNIVVVRDVIEKTEKFYSYPGRFNNVTAIFGVSKELKFKEKSKKLDSNGKPLYLPNTPPIKLYLAESS